MQAHEISEPTAAWEEVLDRTPQPEAGLQSAKWALLKAETGWSPRRFTVGEPERPALVCQVLIRELGPVRIAYAHRGPVWRDDPDRRSLEALVTALAEITPRPTFIRLDPAVSEPVDRWLEELGFRKSFEQLQPELSMAVDLEGSDEELLARMPQNGRYSIRSAEKAGVLIRSADTSRDRAVLERLFAETAKRDRIHTHPLDYYLKHLELLGERAELLVAERKGEVLATAMIEYRGRWATYLHSASSNRGREFMPNYLLQWEAIRRAKSRGCRWYDLRGVGPADSPNHPYHGLRVFKAKFGGVERRYIGAYDLVLDGPRYALYRHGQGLRGLLLKVRR